MTEEIDRAAKAILATRAPGLGRAQWARRAAAAVLETVRTEVPNSPKSQRRHAPAEIRGSREAPIIHVRERQCGGWIGTFDDGSLRFGVTEPTEGETRASLEASERRWRAILSEGSSAPEQPPQDAQ